MSEPFVLRVDESAIKVKDLVDFKAKTGVKWEQAFAPSPEEQNGTTVMVVNVEPEYLQALIWITERQRNPEFSFEDAGEVTLESIEWTTTNTPPDPPKAATSPQES